MLTELQRLWQHVIWADAALLGALALDSAPVDARRQFAHVLGADEVWLSRLEGRPSRLAVWPSLGRDEVQAMAVAIHAGFDRYLSGLDEAGLRRGCAYTNSAGASFDTPVLEILIHVVLHAQYHRGKVNLLLRQAGLSPAPVDYIGFVRGVPAATTRPG